MRAAVLIVPERVTRFNGLFSLFSCTLLCQMTVKSNMRGEGKNSPQSQVWPVPRPHLGLACVSGRRSKFHQSHITSGTWRPPLDILIYPPGSFFIDCQQNRKEGVLTGSSIVPDSLNQSHPALVSAGRLPRGQTAFWTGFASLTEDVLFDQQPLT